MDALTDKWSKRKLKLNFDRIASLKAHVDMNTHGMHEPDWLIETIFSEGCDGAETRLL